MKARSLILSIAVLIAFSFTTLSFAQQKPQDNSKTTSKTEKTVQNKTSQTKMIAHEATLNTKNSKNIKTANLNNQKMAMSNRMKEEKIKMMKNRMKMNYKGKIHLKSKVNKDKKEKSKSNNSSYVK